ncbi:hypothetical protein X797_006433 [Metarhizium robertsii]|uniref:Uncharacterized protein n=1 Tax=Metarhizium robertsii TaxID=568076 RepID=A0A014PR66_9HYPO|nr:hypothetical protein X797_006433 [Metarhizium robertsii]
MLLTSRLSYLPYPIRLDPETHSTKVINSPTSPGSKMPHSSSSKWPAKQSRAHRRAYKCFNALGVLSAGIATAAIVYLHRASTTYQQKPSQRDAVPVVRVFSTQIDILYILSIIIYCTVGMTDILQGRQYWSHCGFVTILVALGIGGFLGLERMLDALVVGGYASLISAKSLARFMDYTSQ